MRKEYLRLSDSLEVYRYLGCCLEGDEELVYRLRLKIGDIWRLQINVLGADSAFVRIDEVNKIQILDRNLDVFALNQYSLPDSVAAGPRIMVADSLGDFHYGYEMLLRTLVGAIIDGKKYGTLTNVEMGKGLTIPPGFELLPNYPNPFNQETTLSFTIQFTQHIDLSIFNARGQRITTLLNQETRPGSYNIVWIGVDEKGAYLPSGLYFSRLAGKNMMTVRKLILMR